MTALPDGKASRYLFVGRAQPRRALSSEGVWAATDVALLGFTVTNAWYRGMPTRNVGSQLKGAYETIIAWNGTWLKRRGALDVLGIDYLVVFEDEARLLAGRPDLIKSAALPTASGPLYFLRNEHSFGDAFVLHRAKLPPGESWRQPVHAAEDCPPNELICGPLNDIVSAKADVGAALKRSHNGLDIALSGEPCADCLLVVSRIDDGNWRASVDGHPVATEPFLTDFIAIPLPEGAAQVHLERRTILRLSTFLLGIITALVLLLVAVRLCLRRP
jgi:hypothetical protein